MDTREGAILERGPFHRLQNTRAGVLKRDVKIRQDFAFGHERDDFIDSGVRIDIVQTHPDTQFREGRAKFGHPGFNRATVPEATAIFHINAIGARVL